MTGLFLRSHFTSLKEEVDYFTRVTNARLAFGAEIECYFTYSDGTPLSDEDRLSFIAILNANLPDFCPEIDSIFPEDGTGQCEIVTQSLFDIPLFCTQVEHIKASASAAAKAEGYYVIFDAKPFANQPGSGLHINVSLWNIPKEGEGKESYQPCNIFAKQGGEESGFLLWSVAGLLKTMPASMRYFAPNEEDYLRYLPSKESPSTLSWGGENRTVSLRIPPTTIDPYARRIEHRVPSVNCKLEESVIAIIRGILYGLAHKELPHLPKIYGDAFLEQYNLPPLPHSLQEANKKYFKGIYNKPWWKISP